MHCLKLFETIDRRQREGFAFIRICVLAILIVAVACVFDGCSCSGNQEQSSGTNNPRNQNTETDADKMADELFAEAGATHPKDYEFKGEILEVNNATTYESVYSKQTLIDELGIRGFGDIEIMSDYDSEGNYVISDPEEEDESDSSQSHPLYYGFFTADNGSAWMLMIAADEIMATQLDDIEATDYQYMVCESDYVTVYDSYSGKFIKGVPDGSEIKLKVVDRLDANTLNGLGELAGEL